MKQLTILFVEDNISAMMIRKRILEMSGYSVVTACDGELAMQLFTSSAPDLVICDYLLQGKSGAELAAEMKQLRPAIPIILMSGRFDQPEGTEHADLFISKSDDTPIWLKKISDVLRKAGKQEAA